MGILCLLFLVILYAGMYIWYIMLIAQTRTAVSRKA